jgi:D-cysteine desulfhydrase
MKPLDSFPRLVLLEGPTPIQRLHRLENSLGVELNGVRLFVKRDDLVGLGGGGNKVRKLEFLLGEAIARGCDTFLTIGAVQSNHARLSAAACARAGLACELVLADVVPRDDADYRRNGNVLLDGLFGATVRFAENFGAALELARNRAEELERAGRRVYVVGSGGSSPVGCLGYVSCAQEIAAQEAELDRRFARVVVPNGSSGTHAGLAAGFMVLGEDPARVKSFTVLAPLEEVRVTTLAKARETLALMGVDADLPEEAIDVSGAQRGAGYGIPTEAGIETIRELASLEGLLIDPVYGAKAFAGLLADVRTGGYESGDAVLFVMTGGTPGLFAYRTAFEGE